MKETCHYTGECPACKARYARQAADVERELGRDSVDNSGNRSGVIIDALLKAAGR